MNNKLNIETMKTKEIRHLMQKEIDSSPDQFSLESYNKLLEDYVQSCLNEIKVVVWKNGSSRIEYGSTWEYENDKDWLTTIQL